MIVGLRSNAFKSMSLNIRYLFYTHLFYFFYGCIYVLDEHYLFCGITMLPPPPVLDLSGPKMCWMKAKFSAVFLLSLIFVCVFKDDWSWYWKGPNHWNGVHHHRLWPEHFGGGNADQQEWCVSCCRLLFFEEILFLSLERGPTWSLSNQINSWMRCQIGARSIMGR